LVARFFVERFLVERFLALRFFPDRFLADFLAPFFLARFLVDFLAAFLFFAIGCGSFRSSAQSHHWSIRRGADIRGETSQTKDNCRKICERLLLAAIVVNGCQTTMRASISARIEPKLDGARQVESEKNRLEAKDFSARDTRPSARPLAINDGSNAGDN
jgi:hypothetical protein